MPSPSAEAAARMFVWQLPRSLAAPPRVQPQSQRKNDQMWRLEGGNVIARQVLVLIPYEIEGQFV